MYKLDFTEFRELILTRLTKLNNIQQVREELQQMKEDHQKSINDLRQTYALQEENTSLRAQMAKMKEDTKQREEPQETAGTHEQPGTRQEPLHSTLPFLSPTTGSQTHLSTPTPSPQTQPLIPTLAPDTSALAKDDPTPFPTATPPYSLSTNWNLVLVLSWCRDGVFAETLKDNALGKSPNSITTAGHHRTFRDPRNTPSQPSSCHPRADVPTHCPPNYREVIAPFQK
eukprot:superscaffoldBa00000526_g5409